MLAANRLGDEMTLVVVMLLRGLEKEQDSVLSGLSTRLIPGTVSRSRYL